jgi:hypothetical protein
MNISKNDNSESLNRILLNISSCGKNIPVLLQHLCIKNFLVHVIKIRKIIAAKTSPPIHIKAIFYRATKFVVK